MPLNEAAGFRRSNLTKEQKREAEAAIYGLTPMNMQDVQQLTPQEIERMRAIVANHDRSGGQIKEFDLNRPPQEPLQFRPFPKMIYHHGKRIYKVIQNEQQLEQHLEDGWNTRPYRELIDGTSDNSVELDDAAAAEAEQVNEQLKRKQKK